MNNPTTILHIAQLSDYENRKPDDDYQCDSLTTEGFIHCCTEDQLADVVSRYYEGMNEITLLKLDVEKLKASLIYENTSGGDELFPHIYGPINTDAIIEALPFGLESKRRLDLFD